MKKLMEADIVVVEKLRSQNYDGLEADMEEVRAAYNSVMDVIQKMG